MADWITNEVPACKSPSSLVAPIVEEVRPATLRISKMKHKRVPSAKASPVLPSKQEPRTGGLIDWTEHGLIKLLGLLAATAGAGFAVGAWSSDVRHSGLAKELQAGAVPSELARNIEAIYPVFAGNAAITDERLRELLDAHTMDVVIVGQNIKTLLKGQLSTVLQEVLSRGGRATVVVTEPEYFDLLAQSEGERQKYLREFATTGKMLEQLRERVAEADRSRFRVYVDPAASALSAIVRDRNSDNRAAIVATAKWAVDVNSDSRLYMLLEKRSNSVLFNVLNGSIPSVTTNDGRPGLDELIQDLRSRCAAAGIEWATVAASH